MRFFPHVDHDDGDVVHGDARRTRAFSPGEGRITALRRRRFGHELRSNRPVGRVTVPHPVRTHDDARGVVRAHGDRRHFGRRHHRARAAAIADGSKHAVRFPDELNILGLEMAYARLSLLKYPDG